MPLTQPERHNPLMRHYFQEINPPGARLARKCGVSHSQTYMARTRNVGADNAEKISRGIANILGLSEEDRLRLKFEIMGFPDNSMRACLGDAKKTERLLRYQVWLYLLYGLLRSPERRLGVGIQIDLDIVRPTRPRPLRIDSHLVARNPSSRY